MAKIKINDCTIRDGGYLFDKNTSPEFVSGVAQGLMTASVDIIEIGFLQDIVSGESIVYKDSNGARKYIPEGGRSSQFTGFCDNSRYSLRSLDEYDGESFEYFRISFAKNEKEDAYEFVAGIKEKGYKVFANPMDAPSYTPEERSRMISVINEIKPYAFSIVDTFGIMYLDDLKSIFTQVNNELDPEIKVGLHTHNNLQLSNALAVVFIDMAVLFDRDVVVDGSLYGLGRGAGNANTEIIAAYLNSKYNKSYNMDVIIDVIEKYIIPVRKSIEYGYDLPMFICGLEKSHVDNVYYLQKEKDCSLSSINMILKNMDIGKRKRYGVGYSKEDFTDLERAYEESMKNLVKQ